MIMEEAIYTPTGDVIGVSNGLRILNLAENPKEARYDFVCADELCRCAVMLKAMGPSAKVFPHFARRTPKDKHAPECEYAEGGGGGRKGGSPFELSGRFTLILGAKQPSAAPSMPGPVNAASAAPSERAPRLTLRALLDLMPSWLPAEMRGTHLSVAGKERALSHLIVRAAWIAHFDVRHGSVRWPSWMGAVTYPDVSDTPHIIIGPATVQGGVAAAPTIRWVHATGGREVVCEPDRELYRQSRFQRRLDRDLARVGCTPAAAAGCVAAVLGTARAAGSRVLISPARSYDDVYVIPAADLDLGHLDSLVEALDARFRAHLEASLRAPERPPEPRIPPLPARPARPEPSRPAPAAAPVIASPPQSARPLPPDESAGYFWPLVILGFIIVMAVSIIALMRTHYRLPAVTIERIPASEPP
jgi:hypothetical protein